MKIKTATIKFNPNWILKQQHSGKSNVINEALDGISKKFGMRMWVIQAEFHKCEVLIADDNMPEEKEIQDFLNKNLKGADETTQTEFKYSEIGKEEIKDLVETRKGSFSEEDKKLFENEFCIKFNDNTKIKTDNVTSEEKKESMPEQR